MSKCIYHLLGENNSYTTYKYIGAAYKNILLFFVLSCCGGLVVRPRLSIKFWKMTVWLGNARLTRRKPGWRKCISCHNVVYTYINFFSLTYIFFCTQVVYAVRNKKGERGKRTFYISTVQKKMNPLSEVTAGSKEIKKIFTYEKKRAVTLSPKKLVQT